MDLHAVVAAVSAALGLYVAAATGRIARVPGWEDQRWFALVALSAALATLASLCTGPYLPDAWVAPLGRIHVALHAVHSAAWIRYADAVLGRPSPRRDRAAAAGLAAAGLLMLIPGVGASNQLVERVNPLNGALYLDPLPTPWAVVMFGVLIASYAWTTLRFALAWRRGVPYAGVLAGAIGLILALGTWDALVAANVVAGLSLLDFGHIVTVATVGFVVAGRFAREARAVSEMRANLSRLVEERTLELARSQEELHRAERLGAIGRLAAGVAHEVNNPASAVAANLAYFGEHLEKGRVPPDALALVRESSQSIDRIAGIVRQLLDASRLAAAPNTPLVPVSVSAAALAAARLATARCGTRVAFVIEASPGVWARAQEQPLVQVLANLAVNGAQAIPAERTDGRVVFGAGRSGDRVRVTVRDDGAGMTEEVRRQVFEPFFTTKSVGRGTGLGLSVSRGMVLGLGGALTLESVPGRGTTATVELAAAEPPAPEAEEPGGQRLAGGRLLIVDDEPDVLAGLGRLLGGHFEVSLANGVEEALDRARSRSFDLVLCDVVMPGGGGLRFQERLLECRPSLAARTIFLTAGAIDAATRGLLAAQPQPVLHKPIDLGSFARAVESLGIGGRPEARPTGTADLLASEL